MTLYDATLPIQEGMLTYPGDPVFKIERILQVAKGARFNLSLMSLATHVGTHVDPPSHYIDGTGSVDQIPLDVMVGPGVVLDMRGRARIDRAALEASELGDHIRVLFKTDNGPKLLETTFWDDYVALTEDGATFLAEQGVKLVGTDYLSIEPPEHDDGRVHKILLNAGALVVEGVHLLEVPSGPCTVYCLPLKILDGDGAPARVLVDTR